MHHAGMKMLRILFPLALTALVGLCLGGCSTTYQQAGIAVTLTDVAVREDNSAVLRLHLRNENIVPVAVTATELKAFFNGTGYGKATGEKPFALKEYGEADHEAILRLGDAAAAERLKSALAAGGLDYRLECRFICEVGEETLILTTTAAGRVERH